MPCSNPNLVDMAHRGPDKKPKFLGPYKTYIQLESVDAEAVEQAIARGQIVKTPCGKCEECAAARATNWGTRCELESKYYEQTLFITFTYDDEHLPVYNSMTGEHYRGIRNVADFYLHGKHYERGNLCKEDLKKAIQRINKEAIKKGYSETGKECRYMACGEYGGKKYRPHYHIIIFGLHPPDLKVERCRTGGKKSIMHYSSEWLTQKWGMGLVDIEEGNFGSARYVAGYIAKKHKDKGLYEALGIVKPYNVMSRRPGIGAWYWSDHRDEIYKDKYNAQIYLREGKTVGVPRYFDRLEENLQLAEEAGGDERALAIYRREIKPEKEDSEAGIAPHKSAKMQELAEHRKNVALIKQQGKLQKTSVTPAEYMEIEHQAFIDTQNGIAHRDRID